MTGELLVDIDSACVDAVHASPNFGPRRDGLTPAILILHYTGMPSAEKAIDWLSRPESNVSCHYVIDEHGRVTQMISETKRAWHAGESFWAGISDVNSASIGIEIQNPGHEHGYPDFPDAQMQSVISLSRDIIQRHGIPARNVLAHSDIAPVRKIDPGEKFDWAGLAAEGVGHWVEPQPLAPLIGEISRQPGRDDVAHAQRLLAQYGYGIEINGQHDAASRTVTRAFQRHFRPKRVDGLLDRSTVATLEYLIAALPVVPTV